MAKTSTRKKNGYKLKEKMRFKFEITKKNSKFYKEKQYRESGRNDQTNSKFYKKTIQREWQCGLVSHDCYSIHING